MPNYLYNGVELPDVNEVWTDELKAQKPYATLLKTAKESEYGLYLSANRPYYGDYVVTDTLVHNGVHIVDGAMYEPRDGNWNKRVDFTVIPEVQDNLIWCSHDILNEDGSVYLAASEPVPVDPEPPILIGDNKRIVLGSGKIYAVEYDGENLPEVDEVCIEENRLGYIKGGSSLQYTEEHAEEKDDLGLAHKTITTHASAVLKCGLITWNLNALRKLLDRYKVSVEGDRRTLKIGGHGNAHGTKYVIVFHHEGKQDGDMWVMIVGRNTAGFTINYGLGAGSLIEPEFKAMPQPGGTLIQLIEEIKTTPAADGSQE